MAITKEEIISKCSPELIASRDCHAIAELVSKGRKRINKREIGYGSILETIGFIEGNAVCDELSTNTMYRFVKPLLEQGRLIVGSDMVSAALAVMTPTVVSKANADKLRGLGLEDDPVSATDVAAVLYNPDGSTK